MVRRTTWNCGSAADRRSSLLNLWWHRRPCLCRWFQTVRHRCHCTSDWKRIRLRDRQLVDIVGAHFGCRRGGTGRRAGLKIQCPQGRVGSIPSVGKPPPLGYETLRSRALANEAAARPTSAAACLNHSLILANDSQERSLLCLFPTPVFRDYLHTMGKRLRSPAT